MINELILACLMCTDGAEHDHNHANGELAASVGAAYLTEDREFAFALHFHGLVAIDEAWSVGVGYERLFGHHTHNMVGLVTQYNIISTWSVAVVPGVAFDDNLKIAPAIHIETAYGFNLGPIHLGPALGTGFDPHGIHFILGVHAGFGF